MGAHTLGSMKVDNSGYSGAWLTNRTVHFNNQYYQMMLSTLIYWENTVTLNFTHNFFL